MIFEVAHQMVLVPALCWLWRRRTLDAAYGWLVLALLISWAADWAADALPPPQRWLPMQVYLVSQAGLIGFVFLSRENAIAWLVVLTLTAFLAIGLTRVQRPDWLLHSVAWLGLVGILARRSHGLLTVALLTLFGGGLVAWLGYVLTPGFPTWAGYQAVRALGLALFCAALLRPPAATRSMGVA